MDLTTARLAVDGLYAAVRADGESLSLEGCIEALTGIQEMENVLSAVKTVLMGQAASREDVWLDDGTCDECTHPVGHIEEDAPDLIAPCFGVTSNVAYGYVERAVAQLTRTPALVEEMAAGRLDAWKARVVTEELADAPDETASAVVDELIARAVKVGGWLETTGPLRRRTQKLLAAITPEVLEDRATNERSFCGLRRRTNSGLVTDTWDATIPVETARQAWEAIDTIAKPAFQAGHASNLSQARMDAMIGLILGNTTATIHLHATLPADTLAEVRADADKAVEPSDPAASQDVSVQQALAISTSVLVPEGAVLPVGGYVGTGTTFLSRPWLSAALGSGLAVNAPDITIDPDTGAILTGDVPSGLNRKLVRKHPTQATGALPPDGGPPTDVGYRIPAAMRRLVKLRDGKCRFPGCSISVTFTDLDHVKAWPVGPTDPSNLACLCRRHHQLKQGVHGRQRWSPTLYADGTMTWLDPVGRLHVTFPVDHASPGGCPTPLPLDLAVKRRRILEWRATTGTGPNSPQRMWELEPEPELTA